MENKKNVYWITGASSGIGKALALYLNEMGNYVILSSRREKELADVLNICAIPENARMLLLDLNQPETFTEKAAEAEACFGRVDVLVNNAGISQRSYILETDLSVYDKLVRINYLGTVGLSKALLPYFIKRKSGHFVTVTSLMGKFGSPLRSGYCGAKHALHGFFDVLRMEHQKDHIAVTMICPGFVQTDVARNALTGDGSAQKSDDQATRNGMPTSVFVRKMVRAMNEKKWEAYIGGKETKGIYLKRFFPKLLHKIVLRSQVV